MSQQPIDDAREPVVVTSLEATMPPTAPEDLLGAGGPPVLVFSHDAGLASVIKRAADGRYPLRVINEWQDLIRLVRTDVGRIVMLDVDALNRPVDKALAELNQTADWLVVVIAAKQQEAQDFMRFWSERRIHRLLIKPAALGITRLLLESAIARYVELHELHEETDSLEIPPGLRDYDLSGARLKRWYIGVGVGLLVLAGIGWYWLRGPLVGGDSESARERAPFARPESEPGLDTQVSSTVAVLDAEGPQKVDPHADSMAAAAQAELDGRLTAPATDNALDRYLDILDAAPDYAAARAALDGLLARLFMQAEELFLAEDLDGAERLLADLRRADPSSTRLRFLSEQLAQARSVAVLAAAAEAAVAEAAAAEAAAAAAARVVPPVSEPTAQAPPANRELASMLTLARRRIEQGQLVAPDGDSASDYLRRAIDLDARNTEVRDAVSRLLALLTAEAGPALTAGDIDRAEALVTAALELGPASAELARLHDQLIAARAARSTERLAELAEQTADRLGQNRLIGAESAVASLHELQSLDASHVRLPELEAAVVDAIVGSTRAAIDSSNWSRATELLDALDTIIVGDARAALLRRELEHGRRQAQFLIEPVPIGELELLRASEPEYPRAALQRETSGWVDMQFTVDEEGRTRDIVVTEAEPLGTFDDAAIAAVGRYRFAPFELDGEIYARRARVRLRFVFD